MHKKQHDSTSHSPGYEVQDVKGKLVFWSLAVLTVITVICVFVAAWMFNVLDQKFPTTARQVPSVAGADRVLPPEPRLQALPPLDLEKYEADQHAATSTYGWVDKSAQRLHIPVDLAIELTVQRGLPHVKPGDPLPVVTPPVQPAPVPAAATDTAAQPAPPAPSAGVQ